MDINKIVYWVLITGMLVGNALLATSVTLNIFFQDSKTLSIMIAFLGTAVLIATPYVTIASIILASAINKDYKLLVISLIILLVMVSSLLFGLIFRKTPKS